MRRVFMVLLDGTITIVALPSIGAGLRFSEQGLQWVLSASGLSNTALQTGTALGVAIVTTVAVSRSQHYLAADNGANPLAALTQGYQSAFLACAVLAGIGLALAFLLPGRPRKPAHELPEPDPAADAAAAGDVVIRSGTK
jgi:MFS family permease